MSQGMDSQTAAPVLVTGPPENTGAALLAALAWGGTPARAMVRKEGDLARLQRPGWSAVLARIHRRS